MGQSKFLLWDSVNFADVANNAHAQEPSCKLVSRQDPFSYRPQLFTYGRVSPAQLSELRVSDIPVQRLPRLHENNNLLKEVLHGVLVSRVDRNAAAKVWPAGTAFHAAKPPPVSVGDYLARLMKYAFCSNASLVMAVCYLDRLAADRACFELSPLNAHRMMITALMLAAKFHDDVYYNNAYYAKVGGVPLREMNILEVEFLKFIKFDLHISLERYESFEAKLIGEVLASSHPACGPAKKMLAELGYRAPCTGFVLDGVVRNPSWGNRMELQSPVNVNVCFNGEENYAQFKC